MAVGLVSLRTHSRRLVAATVVIALFVLMKQPQQPEAALAAPRFHFSRASLADVPGPEIRKVRRVQAEFKAVDNFMSSIGAAIAINDLDGDGLSNDICLVDTRTDQVIIQPAPGTGTRYAPFALSMSPELFDRNKMAPYGCLPADFNEDGHVDLLVSFTGRSPILFLWRGPGDYLARPLPVDGRNWFTTTVNTADLDGDGHLDLIIGNYAASTANVYDERDGGTIETPHSFSRATNGGGIHIFLFAGATGGSDPDVRWIDATDAVPEPARHGWVLATGAQDLDGDLLPELYIANDFGPDRLLHNRSKPGHLSFALLEGESGFTIPSSLVLGRDSFKGMGVDFGDLNGDGFPDIYVSNITDPMGLLESQFAFVSTGQIERMKDGVAPYVEQSEALGLARSAWCWDTRLDDFDNDGVLEALQACRFVVGTVSRWPEFQELALSNDGVTYHPRWSWPALKLGDDLGGRGHNHFFAAVKGKYVDISRQIGFGEEYASRGIATADVDGDGALDVVVANMWGPSTYYHNDCKTCGGFLGLHLMLPLQPDLVKKTDVRAGHPGKDASGRAAIGAQAVVTLPDGRKLIRQVDGGNGHSGKRSPDLHFGLGDVTGPVKVDLRWRNPDGVARSESFTLAPGWHTVQLSWTR
ncbi:MAG TPA: CRTAC1 family protein [Bradyrhizobium sp.]|nr:CRTAC1 family protein [Bradyrhizobium sp.]